ncbi:MAG: vWA domain-containing protein [Rubricella sp.]
MSIKPLAIFALAALLGGAGVALPAAAQDRPLLVEGRESIYQRVITRPGALLRDGPDGAAIDTLTPFQPLYVYGRSGDWLSVGPSSTLGPTGHVAAGETVEWRQNIVASFTNAAGRNRQILFDTRDNLNWLLNHEALVEMQAELLAEADAGAVRPESGVVSVEPAEFVDIRESFYLMPILDFVEEFHPVDYSPLLQMEVASLPLEEENSAPGGIGMEFEAGVVFVIDTTQSMDPYIRRTRDAVASIIEGVRESDVGPRIHFGAIGFRDNPEAASGLEYRTAVIHPLDRASEPDAILEALDTTQVARVSSPGFNEDSLAGVQDGIIATDWDQEGRPFGGRYIILISDAGPKDPRDANARSEIGVREIQTLAEENGIAILTLHLQTTAGAANHAYAEGQYRQLSRFGDLEFYYPIEGGSEAVFREQIGTLVANLTDHVRVAMGQEPEAPEADPRLDELGFAMRLRYLGAAQGTAAPDVIRAWVTDRAAENPARAALTPRLLISRNELSSMTTILEEIVAAGESTQSQDDPARFFRQVRDAVSRLAVNPDLVVNSDFETLGGAVGEFLVGLPYRSQIMDLTEDRWINAGTERREIIDGLRQKLSLYRQIHNDPANWTPLFDGAPDGEHVYAIPFSILP